MELCILIILSFFIILIILIINFIKNDKLNFIKNDKLINIVNLKKNREKIYLGNLSRLKFKNVAIVGSGGILLKYKKGHEIDSNDAVFRFNDAPVRGFQEYVGSKTTFRSSYGIDCGRFSYHENIICFHENKYSKKSWEIYQKNNILHKNIYKDAYKDIDFNAKWYSFNDNNSSLFFEINGNKISWNQMTTGLKTIILAILISDNVNIYGFSAGLSINDKKKFKYHYYEDMKLPGYQTTDKKNAHNYNIEGEIIKYFIENNYVNNKTL